MAGKRNSAALARQAHEWFTEERIRRTRRRLLRWGTSNFRAFPWRFERDPWLGFVAEFLLQRTRASQVEPVFRFIQERYPTSRSLLKGGDHASNELTSQLGLHRRGEYLIKVATEIEQRGGRVPEDPKYLLSLPGVGMYTTAAWLSLHRGKRAVIIDANVARWLSRMTGLPYNRDPRGIRWIQELADRLTPKRVFRDYNYAVLDLTMTVCVPMTPRCEVCPLRSDCQYILNSGGGAMLSRQA